MPWAWLGQVNVVQGREEVQHLLPPAPSGKQSQNDLIGFWLEARLHQALSTQHQDERWKTQPPSLEKIHFLLSVEHPLPGDSWSGAEAPALLPADSGEPDALCCATGLQIGPHAQEVCPQLGRFCGLRCKPLIPQRGMANRHWGHDGPPPSTLVIRIIAPVGGWCHPTQICVLDVPWQAGLFTTEHPKDDKRVSQE